MVGPRARRTSGRCWLRPSRRLRAYDWSAGVERFRPTRGTDSAARWANGSTKVPAERWESCSAKARAGPGSHPTAWSGAGEPGALRWVERSGRCAPGRSTEPLAAADGSASPGRSAGSGERNASSRRGAAPSVRSAAGERNSAARPRAPSVGSRSGADRSRRSARPWPMAAAACSAWLAPTAAPDSMVPPSRMAAAACSAWPAPKAAPDSTVPLSRTDAAACSALSAPRAAPGSTAPPSRTDAAARSVWLAPTVVPVRSVWPVRTNGPSAPEPPGPTRRHARTASRSVPTGGPTRRHVHRRCSRVSPGPSSTCGRRFLPSRHQHEWSERSAPTSCWRRRRSGPARSACCWPGLPTLRHGARPSLSTTHSPGSPCSAWSPRPGATDDRSLRHGVHRRRRRYARGAANTTGPSGRRSSRPDIRPSNSPTDRRPSTGPRGPRRDPSRRRTGRAGTPSSSPTHPSGAASYALDRSHGDTVRTPRSPRTSPRTDPSSCSSTSPSSSSC
jgi:hypothetical protein